MQSPTGNDWLWWQTQLYNCWLHSKIRLGWLSGDNLDCASYGAAVSITAGGKKERISNLFSPIFSQWRAGVHADVRITQQATHLLREIAVVMATTYLLVRLVLKPCRQLRTTLHTRNVVTVLLTFNDQSPRRIITPTNHHAGFSHRPPEKTLLGCSQSCLSMIRRKSCRTFKFSKRILVLLGIYQFLFSAFSLRNICKKKTFFWKLLETYFCDEKSRHYTNSWFPHFTESAWFTTESNVCQGCVLAPRWDRLLERTVGARMIEWSAIFRSQFCQTKTCS